jgi:plasmid maintenance system antidote protein VapI
MGKTYKDITKSKTLLLDSILHDKCISRSAAMKEIGTTRSKYYASIPAKAYETFIRKSQSRTREFYTNLLGGIKTIGNTAVEINKLVNDHANLTIDTCAEFVKKHEKLTDESCSEFIKQHENDWTFDPEKLSEAIKKSCLSQKDVADKLGIHFVTLNIFLNNKQRPTRETNHYFIIEKFCKEYFCF